MEHIKRLFVIFMALFFVGSTAGCNKDPAESEVMSESNKITAKEIIQKLVEQSGDENLNSFAFFDEDIFKENCKKLYGIEYDELSDGGIVFSGSGGLADEVTIICGRNGKTEKLLDLLSERIERRIRDFTGYKPSEISKIENGVVFEHGGFAVLIISDNCESLKGQIKDIISQKNGE